jgi:serine/threonine-protein kinase
MTEVTPDTLVDGRYRVLNRLGSGGMADVYCAEDSHLGRQVALKVLYQRFAQDAEFVERFKREAQAAAGLTHPNVVNVFDRGEHDGTYYIAMEYLPGSTLKEVIAERGALDQEAVIDIGVQILRAASFAHRRGVVHRDLKPHNVMLDDAGNAKVTDFGIARARSWARRSTSRPSRRRASSRPRSPTSTRSGSFSTSSSPAGSHSTGRALWRSLSST